MDEESKRGQVVMQLHAMIDRLEAGEYLGVYLAAVDTSGEAMAFYGGAPSVKSLVMEAVTTDWVRYHLSRIRVAEGLQIKGGN